MTATFLTHRLSARQASGGGRNPNEGQPSAECGRLGFGSGGLSLASPPPTHGGRQGAAAFFVLVFGRGTLSTGAGAATESVRAFDVDTACPAAKVLGSSTVIGSFTNLV